MSQRPRFVRPYYDRIAEKVKELNMTDEERRNRNPQPEVSHINPEEHPEVNWWDLEKDRVYILVGPTMAASFNYVGPTLGSYPDNATQAFRGHEFHGPRASLVVHLKECADGTVEDGSGAKIRLLKYTGPDA